MSFCFLVNEVGTCVFILMYKSPKAFPLKTGIPFPRSLNCLPCCVPAGILILDLPPSIDGTSTDVPSIDGGKSKIKIPAGTQHGKQFRLKGKGMPVLRGSVFGDLYIRINTQVPTSLTKKQKEILEEFNKIESNKPDPIIKSFFEKAKKFWKNS